MLNGACKFHGLSLNKSLLFVAKLTVRLTPTVRPTPAVSADIEIMFLQVGVLPEDQPSLRFLWREDASTDVMVYQYTRHMIGARDSPTRSNFALQQTAKDNESIYPEAAAAVCKKF